MYKRKSMYKQMDNEGVKYMELYRGKIAKRFADVPECRTDLVKQGIIKAGFLYGSLVIDNVNGKRYICTSAIASDRSYINNATATMFEVDRATVGVFTGKELDGVKLFTGDIIETYEDYDVCFGYPTGGNFRSVVIWSNKDFCFEIETNGCVQSFNAWYWEYAHIVGNIYDNPELLRNT